VLAAHRGGELELRAREVDVRREEAQSLGRGLEEGLRVHVDQDDAAAGESQGRAEIGAGRGLAHPALLIDDRNAPHGRGGV